MSQSTPTSPRAAVLRGPWLRRAALAAVVLVPLAFAGLFIGAASNVSTGIGDIPAAVVNNDTAVTQAGSTTPVLAGRQLVTELTGKKSAGFRWTITNSKDARAELANGTVYAILTVPKNFSKSITSLSGSDPTKANLRITTDDSHNYLTGSVAQIVGDSLSSAFGKAVTKEYVAGLYSGIGTLGSSLASAASGAGKIGDGASSLASGLHTLSAGTASSASGATRLSSGVGQYVAGVSRIPGGLRALQAGTTAAGRQVVARAVAPYTGGMLALSNQLAADVAANDTSAIKADSDNIAALAAHGTAVAGGVQQGFDSVASSTGTFANQTSALATGGAKLSSGTSSLAAGLHQLADGTAASASGASSLATGANTLATGLSSGAKQVPTGSAEQGKATAAVAADPVGVSVDRNHEVSSPAQIIATLFIPLGLWIGSLAVFLVLRPLSRRALTSTARNGRLVLRTIGRASIVTAAQGVTLALLLHAVVGVSWSLFPATLVFSVLMALAFTAFHYLLTIGLGRGGLVVSIFLLAAQIVSTGGLYPIQLLARPFQLISPFLPLTYGVQGMQAIIANSGATSAIGAAVALAVFGVGSILIAFLAVRRVRGARALGLVPA